MGEQLSIFTPQFDFSGKIRKVDIDGQSFVSVFDVLEKYSTDSNPRRAYADAIKLLEAQESEVVQNPYNLRMHKFPGPGQRETPVGNIQFFTRLINVIEVPEWENIRVWMNDIVVNFIENTPQIEPPKNRRERVLVDKAIVYGKMDKPAAYHRLQNRRDTGYTYKQMMASLTKAVNSPNYGQFASEEYIALFGYTARELAVFLKTDSVRDALTDTQLRGLQFVESAMKDKLDKMTDATMQDVIQELRRLCIKARALLEEVDPIIPVQVDKPLLTAGRKKKR